MILWRPHTETPDEPGTVAIIAAMHAHPHLVRLYRRPAP